MATHRGYNSWLARVKVQGVEFNLGTFKTQEEAVEQEENFKENLKQEGQRV